MIKVALNNQADHVVVKLITFAQSGESLDSPEGQRLLSEVMKAIDDKSIAFQELKVDLLHIYIQKCNKILESTYSISSVS